MILAFEDSISKLLDIDCGANIEAQERVDNSLVEILKLKFGCHECSSLLEAGIVDDLYNDFFNVDHNDIKGGVMKHSLSRSKFSHF